MLEKTTIVCTECKLDTGYKHEDFTYFVAFSDVTCPHCGAIIIKANRIEM